MGLAPTERASLFWTHNRTLTFDDAGEPLPASGGFLSGTFAPSNEGLGDSLPAPAPPPGYGAALAVFHGTDPNGIWQLFVFDDAGADTGTIAGGWSLTIETSTGTIPPVFVLLRNLIAYDTGDTFRMTATLAPGTLPGLVDVYIVVMAPDGALSSFTAAGFVPGVVPAASGITPVPFSGTIVGPVVLPTIPTGLYRFFGALTEAGTLNIVGSISEEAFVFTP